MKNLVQFKPVKVFLHQFFELFVAGSALGKKHLDLLEIGEETDVLQLFLVT